LDDAVSEGFGIHAIGTTVARFGTCWRAVNAAQFREGDARLGYRWSGADEVTKRTSVSLISAL